MARRPGWKAVQLGEMQARAQEIVAELQAARRPGDIGVMIAEALLAVGRWAATRTWGRSSSASAS